jgi:hypothetical protein
MHQEQDPFLELAKSFSSSDSDVLSSRVQALADFTNQPIDDEELEEITRADLIQQEIANLDSMCEHMHEPVFVSGKLTYSYFNEVTGRNEIASFFADNQIFIFEGFAALSLPSDDGYGPQQIGQVFQFPDMNKVDSYAPLTQTTTQYYAFAPYGSVTVEPYAPTPKEEIEYLQRIIPDVVEDVDEALNANTHIGSLMKLGRMSIDSRHIPSDAKKALASYALETMGLDPSELFEVKVKNIAITQIEGDSVSYTTHDISQPNGGQNTLLAHFNGLAIMPYLSYVEGQVYHTSDLRWHLMARVVGNKNHPDRLYDSYIAIADIVDMQSVQDIIANRWSDNVVG